jgi:tRNA G18 (ribose-2'-O)-methylase SpoU
MVQFQEISALDAPELAPYRTMRAQQDHSREGIFVAEGEKVVRRLLESNLTVISVLLPGRWAEDLRPILENRPELIQAYVAEKKVLENLTGFSMYQGVLGLGIIPKFLTLDELFPTLEPPFLLAAVDGVSSAENLGAIVRSCVAFGVQALILGETNCSPYLRRAVRSSMGTVFKLPVVETDSLEETITELSRRGIATIAAHPHTEEKFLSKAPLWENCCIVFGAEGPGLSHAVLEACEHKVAVRMHPGVDSLNVGTAAAVFLYEAARQRGLT